MARGDHLRGKRPEGAGRRPGSQNKITISIKAAFAEAFDKLGGADALVRWAQKEPTEFYKLSTKLIPTEMAGGVKIITEIRDPTKRVDAGD